MSENEPVPAPKPSEPESPSGVRLEDIAVRSGVSISTVSRVLNDKPGVSSNTRRLVLTALDVLGYERPSRLRPSSSALVGMVVPELENPFFARLAGQLEVDLARRRFTAVVGSQSLGGVHEDSYVQTLLDHGVAGLVIVSGIHALVETDPTRYRRLTDQGVPVVLVNGYQSEVGAACVSIDDAAMVDMAVAHLAHMGHRRIGLALGQGRYTPAVRRSSAFAPSMRRHVDPELGEATLEQLRVFSAYSVNGGAEAAATLLDRGATALVCGSDVMALGAIREARRQGLHVPGDVSVIGSDDSMMTEFTDPALTTVRQPVRALSQEICRALTALVGGEPPPTLEMLIEPELVVRGSTGRAP